MNLPKNKKILILGIGNKLKTDDGVGSLIAESLGRSFENVIDCGTAPENFLGKILKYSPDHILIIDTVDLSEKPGTAKMIDLEGNNLVQFSSISTHRLSLTTFANLLLSELDSKISLLGIQPESTEFGEKLSSPVLKTKEEVEKYLSKFLET